MPDNASNLERKRLRTQLKKRSAEISEIKIKYNVKTASELEKKIERSTVKEHPAWEDLILMENLEEEIKKNAADPGQNQRSRRH